MSISASNGRTCAKCGKLLRTSPQHDTCWDCRHSQIGGSMQAEAARELWEEMRSVPEEQPRDPLTMPSLPASPESLFGCRELRLPIAGAKCLELQGRDPDDEKNRKRFCASGECLQGARVKLHLERLKAVRICSVCRRVQLGERNVDGVCSMCRPAGAPPPAFSYGGEGVSLVDLTKTSPGVVLRSGGSPAPTPRPISQFSPTLTRPEYKKMADKKICSVEGCNTPLRSNNTTGKCSPHARPWKHKSTGGAPPAKAAAPAKQSALALPVTVRQLPAVKALPNEYLLEAVTEFKRRAAEMYRAARELGFDPAKATTPAASEPAVAGPEAA